MTKLRKIDAYSRRVHVPEREIWDPIIIEARAYRDAESDEYRVRFYRDGKLNEAADSFHPDKDDALSTMRHALDHEALRLSNPY